jgi:hypothetical protein
MTDDQLLAEILQSPLGDKPVRRGKWVRIGGTALVGVLVAGAALLLARSGDDAAVTPAVATTAGGSAVAVVPDEGSGSTAAAVVAGPQVYPAAGGFHEMVALGDGQILMFGGLVFLDDASRPFEGTWIFDATTGEWKVAEADVAPSSRVGHAMALHPPTGKVVLFGGGTAEMRPCPLTRFCAGAEDNQVWHYDPASGGWEDMTPPVPDEDTWPTARFGARFVYEPVTERLIMFSGVGVFGDELTPTFYTDTWAYDPVTNEWENLTRPDAEVSGPIGRTTYGMAWSDEVERVMLFAGDSLAGTDDDHLWAFDPGDGSWEDRGIAETGPYERWYHLLTVDPQSGRLVLIGGTGSIITPIQGGSIRNIEPLDEVWTWSEAEGWSAQNRMATVMTPVSGVAEPGTLAIITYDGHDVMSYDVALDLWTSLAHREETDDE